MSNDDFIKYLKELKINPTKTQLEQLNEYYNLLIEWNKKINLTSITKKEDVYLKHFYDSLTITKIVDLDKEENLCDIGTGAGFPGIVIKIFFPNLNVTLVDSLNKRINFLNIVIEKLGLKNIECIHARAEEFAKENRNRFDISTARAVAPLSVLIEYMIPLTKKGKYLIALKGKEETNYENAIKQLSCTLVEKISFELPHEMSKRTLYKIKKNKDNTRFPRKNSEIKKNQL